MKLKFLGGFSDFAWMDTLCPTTASIAGSSSGLEDFTSNLEDMTSNLEDITSNLEDFTSNPEEMTDALRPYFMDRNITAYSNLAIYIFSAVLRENIPGETENRTFSHVVHLSGWELGHHRREKLKCCYIWDDRHLSERNDPGRIYSGFKIRKSTLFESVHYKCSLNEPERLLGSYVVPISINCADFQYRAIRPQVPLPGKNGSIGVCLKILYGAIVCVCPIKVYICHIVFWTVSTTFYIWFFVY